jgi:hypothetical protein
MGPPKSLGGPPSSEAGARSGGGTAGGVTGSRSQPTHGPASIVANSVLSDKRVTRGPGGAAPPSTSRVPRAQVEQEGLLEVP